MNTALSMTSRVTRSEDTSGRVSAGQGPCSHPCWGLTDRRFRGGGRLSPWPSGSDTGARRPGAGAAARGLLKACHPGPCVTVTGLAVAIGWAIGLSPGRLALLGAAVLHGPACRSAGSTTCSTGRRT